MTESIIERVARAICNECNDQPYDALPETATYLERKTHVYRAMLDKQEARQVARAAIEAIREPTPATLEAMKVNIGPLGAMWRAGVDAALNEQEAGVPSGLQALKEAEAEKEDNRDET